MKKKVTRSKFKVLVLLSLSPSFLVVFLLLLRGGGGGGREATAGMDDWHGRRFFNYNGFRGEGENGNGFGVGFVAVTGE